MRVETLPSPGLLASGLRLRVEAAKAISAVEINAGIPANAGISSSADPLHDFFTACANSLTAMRDVTAPAIAARSATSANPSLIILTYSEGLDPARVPLPAAFLVTTQSRTVTKVQLDGPFVFLTLDAPLIAGAVTVQYVVPTPVDERLSDSSDNECIAFTNPVTNTIT